MNTLNIQRVPVELLADIELRGMVYQYMIIEGGTDVLLVSAVGEKQKISRAELINNYRNADGSKIKLSNVRVGKKYTAMLVTKSNKKGLMLPSKTKIEGLESRYKSGYLLIDADAVTGKYVDMSGCTVTPKALFNKVCIITELPSSMTEAIQEVKTGKRQINKPVETKAPARQTQEKPTETVAVEDDELRCTEVGKCVLVALVTNGNAQGYIIKARNGKTRTLNEQEMFKATREHKVQNCEVRTNTDGTESLIVTYGADKIKQVNA